MKDTDDRSHPSRAGVVADIEHLRKLFIMPDSPDKFVEFGNELLKPDTQFFSG